MFPTAVDDVLADEYGMCEDGAVCFGRLPEWLEETGSELVVTDGTTTISLTFSEHNDVAHQAWQVGSFGCRLCSDCSS